MLYIIKKDKIDINAIETQNGFRCLIEDISESGALIRIGGKGVQNVKIKLQYNIQNKLILMVGIIRTVEFNEEQNQSLLHFECTHIETSMRNEVLKFVYNMMPQNEKEVLEALEQTEDDEYQELAQKETDDTLNERKESEANNEARNEAKKEAADDVANDIAEATGATTNVPNVVPGDNSADKSDKAGSKASSDDDIPYKEDEINVF